LKIEEPKPEKTEPVPKEIRKKKPGGRKDASDPRF
jgi:hypothetical protein